MTEHRIVILDNQTLTRSGLRVLVERAGFAAGQTTEFANADRLLAYLDTATARVLLLSDRLPEGQDIVSLVQQLHLKHPGLAIAIIGSRLNTEYIGALFTAGARAYIYRKSKLEEQIPAAIKVLLAGETFLSPKAAALPYHQRRIDELSERDLEVLQMLARGRSVRDIAATLSVTRRVIYYTRTRLKQYLDVHTNEQLIPAAQDAGLLTD